MKILTGFNEIQIYIRDISILMGLIKEEIQRANSKDEIVNTFLNEIIDTCKDCIERKPINRL